MTSGNRNNHRKLQLLGCSVSSQEIDQFPPDSGNSTLSLDQKRISLYFFHLKISIGLVVVGILSCFDFQQKNAINVAVIDVMLLFLEPIILPNFPQSYFVPNVWL